MVNGKQRLLENLYDATAAPFQPQVSPVLQGSFRMQGPVDESDRAYMMPGLIGKEYSSCSENSKYHHRPESRTCSTPCSSCSHLMTSKVGECFGEASSEGSCRNVEHEGSCRNSDLSATSDIVTGKFGDNIEGEHRDPQSHVYDSRMSHFTCNGDNTKPFSTPVSANTSFAQESVSMAPLSAASGAALSSHSSGLLESHSDTVGDTIDKSDAEVNPLHCGVLFENSNEAARSSPKGEESVKIQTDSLEKDLDKVEKNEGSENAKVKENSLESLSGQEGDDSDLGQIDVKVCDICGDAGREDLLAICSRCSDGAEHTYCMREMMDKAPSGEWLCEECQFGVQIKGRSQETVDIEASAKTNSSGGISGNKKSLAKVSDVDENRIGNGPTGKILGKRQADGVEPSNPGKRRVLESDKGSIRVSRNSSFKSDRLKTKSNQNASSDSLALAGSPSASRPRTQGSYNKSKSFSSLNVKPKVSRQDDVIPQKQRSGRDSASLDRKEGALRSIRKSVSFKSPNMSRLNPGESKVKLLSRQGSKNSKDRALEKKNSFQSERPPMSNSAGPASKNEQKLASSTVEKPEPSSSKKNRDVKALPSDGRPIPPLSKSSSFAARRGSVPSSLDNANESFRDGLSQQKESLDFGEKAKDSISGKSREGSEDRMKVALEAAAVKKSIWKNRQSNGTTLASLNNDIADQVLSSDSNNKGNVIILSEVKEDRPPEIADSTVKHFPGFSSEGSRLKTAESFPVPLEGVSLGSYVPTHVSETFCERLAIPDLEDVWKGVFEVHNVGRTINMFDGIQAHLSTCASPKVLEAVTTFDQKVILNEVPRLTTWPVQFQENGVKEENIAVFFFAKDSISYERSYRVLLNNMMKNDVALVGKFDEFELLIFPSSQLPEKSQCWNTLFFMWGVFRGKRANKHVAGSDEQTSLPSDVQGDMAVSAPPASETRSSELILKEACIGGVSDGGTSFSAIPSSIARSFGETAKNNGRLEEKGNADRGNGSDESQQMRPDLNSPPEQVSESFFFPVVPEAGREAAPNLELNLWGGKEELNLNVEAVEEEEAAAPMPSLSLSLAFPFPDAEQDAVRAAEHRFI